MRSNPLRLVQRVPQGIFETKTPNNTLEKRKGASDKRSVLDLHGLELGGVRRTRTRSQEWPAELI